MFLWFQRSVRSSFQNNHGGGVVTGMGDRDVQRGHAEGVGPLPSLAGEDEFGFAGRERTYGHVAGADAVRESRAERLDRGLLDRETRGDVGDGARRRRGGFARNGPPFLISHDAFKEMPAEAAQAALHAGKFDHVQSDADDCHRDTSGAGCRPRGVKSS